MNWLQIEMHQSCTSELVTMQMRSHCDARTSRRTRSGASERCERQQRQYAVDCDEQAHWHSLVPRLVRTALRSHISTACDSAVAVAVVAAVVAAVLAVAVVAVRSSVSSSPAAVSRPMRLAGFDRDPLLSSLAEDSLALSELGPVQVQVQEQVQQHESPELLLLDRARKQSSVLVGAVGVVVRRCALCPVLEARVVSLPPMKRTACSWLRLVPTTPSHAVADHTHTLRSQAMRQCSEWRSAMRLFERRDRPRRDEE